MTVTPTDLRRQANAAQRVTPETAEARLKGLCASMAAQFNGMKQEIHAITALYVTGQNDSDQQMRSRQLLAAADTIDELNRRLSDVRADYQSADRQLKEALGVIEQRNGEIGNLQKDVRRTEERRNEYASALTTANLAKDELCGQLEEMQKLYDDALSDGDTNAEFIRSLPIIFETLARGVHLKAPEEEGHVQEWIARLEDRLRRQREMTHDTNESLRKEIEVLKRDNERLMQQINGKGQSIIDLDTIEANLKIGGTAPKISGAVAPANAVPLPREIHESIAFHVREALLRECRPGGALYGKR